MAAARQLGAGRRFLGRLAAGEDLLEGLTEACAERALTLGRVEAIGTVSRARLGYFNQGTRAYEYLVLDRPLEITNLTGNVSLRDGRLMVHAHVTMADEQGRAFGGHLASGCVIFACEFLLEEFTGTPLVREVEPETGLALWRL